MAKRLVPFQKELADILKERLNKVGIGVVNDNPESIMIQYITLVNRLVIPMQRQVLFAKDFKCPENLAEGLNLFIRKSENGEDLNPHLSKTMKISGFTDQMLAAWQVFHFHLGKEIKDGYVERNGDILYAMIKNNKILALKIDEHNQWSDKDLLNIAHENWPDLTSDWDVEGTPVVDYSSEEIGEARKENINVVVKRADGSSTIGGYGLTAAGTSAESSLIMIDINNWLVKAYETAIESFGTTELKLGINKDTDNFVIYAEEGKGAIPVCRFPDITKYAYLFQ